MTVEQVKATTDWLDKSRVRSRIEGGHVIALESFDIPGNDRVHLPALAEVSGSVYVRQGATFEAPALAKSGSVYVQQGATFDAPALRTVGHLAYQTELLGHTVEVFDEIGTVTQSAKTVDGITIRKCCKASFEDGNLVGDVMYVVSRGEHNAHGETVKDAVADLSFKEADKDASQYRGMPLDTEKSVEDWVAVYRIVTGACQLGCKDFIKSKGALKQTYTLREVLEMVDGAYQSDRFRELVSA